jgi:hypothetical protein
LGGVGGRTVTGVATTAPGVTGMDESTAAAEAVAGGGAGSTSGALLGQAMARRPNSIQDRICMAQ